MRKFAFGLAGMAGAALMATGAHAQSAKFSTDWATDDVELATIEITDCDLSTADCNAEEENLHVAAADLIATMKVPQGKEALIGVSGEASLITFTEAKGKNDGGEVKSSAEATMELTVKLAPTDYAVVDGVCVDDSVQIVTAAPGPVTFASRIQELTVSSSGFDNLEGEIAVALKLNTVAAHHFNFVAYDLTADEYDIYACFGGKAVADVVLGSGGTDGSGSANATVAIQKRMLTVQEVRAVQGDFIE